MKQDEVDGGALNICCFGEFKVELGGEPLRRLRSPKGLRVLAYLALDPGKPVRKSWLAEVLWPEKEAADTDTVVGDRAVANLDRTLRDLRRALGDPPRKPVRLCLVGHDRLQLQLQSADRIDTVVFEQMLRRADSAGLQKAVDLYQGPLLHGWGSREGEGWIDDRREQYRRQYANALKRLCALAIAEKRTEAALEIMRRQLRAGERDETDWCDLMRLFVEKRDFESAVQVYERLAEYVASPSPGIRALWAQIPEGPKNAYRDKRMPDLPRFFTSLLGREQEIADIQKRIETGVSRLIVLTGTGGVGKTRLAIALGHARSGGFAQGVRFIDLTAATDAASVLFQVCSVFKVSDKRELLTLLQPKEVLLILDNCEQASAACSDLTHALLTACPRLHILATSRQAFQLGEIAWEVPCLALPTPAGSTAPEALLQFSAIQLFHERAQAVARTFELTPVNAASVVEICRRLDGLPLAIELAAVRLRTLSPQEIETRLIDRFALLNRGSHSAPQRHQTLRATIAWSYDLLDENESRLLRRLSVFAGGWTEAAALAVCADAGADPDRLRDLLEELTAKSLLVRSGETVSRFRMLESILRYAAEKLSEDADEERLYRQKHRDYFLELAVSINETLSGPQQAQLLNTLDAEVHNLDQALKFCLTDTAGVQEGLRLGAALQEFWWIRGYLRVGRDHLAALLQRPMAQKRTRARAAALDGAGTLARMQGDYPSARALHEESVEIFKELNLEGRAAYALGNLAIVVWLQKEAALARDLTMESLALHRRLKNEEGVAYCLGNLGNMAHESQDYAAAQWWLDECLKRLREQKNAAGIANCLYNLGTLAYHRKETASAYALLEESLTLKRKLQEKLGIAVCLEALADLAFQENRVERAVHLRGAEDRLREEIGSPKEADAKAEGDLQSAKALQTLGETLFSQAREAGYAMPLEEAIAYALHRTGAD